MAEEAESLSLRWLQCGAPVPPAPQRGQRRGGPGSLRLSPSRPLETRPGPFGTPRKGAVFRARPRSRVLSSLLPSESSRAVNPAPRVPPGPPPPCRSRRGGHVVAFGRGALSSGSDLGRPVGHLRLVLALASTSSSGQCPRTRPVGGALWADDSQVTCKPWRGAKSRVREARPG